MSALTRLDRPEIWLNAKQYGATGDGVTDDSTAIQAAITAASASLVSRTVFLPPGTYKCAITQSPKIILIGAGSSGIGSWDGAVSGVTTLIPASDASPVVSITNLDQQEIHDLNIRGNGSGTSVKGLSIANGGETYPGSGFVAKSVVICDFTACYYVASATNVTFTNCGLLNGDKPIHLKGGADSHTFEGCCLGGLPTGWAIYSEGNSGCLNIMNCEMGNSLKLLYQGGISSIFFIGGNVETVSETFMVLHELGNLSFYGTRFLLDNTQKCLVRSTAPAHAYLIFDGILKLQWTNYLSTGRPLLVETSDLTHGPYISMKGTQGTVRYVTSGTFVTTSRLEDERNCVAPLGLRLDPDSVGDNNPILEKTADANYGSWRFMSNGAVRWDVGLFGDNDLAISWVGDHKTVWAEYSTYDWVVNEGNIRVGLAGKGLRVKEGSNAKQGVSTLVAGTVTVANTSVTANSRIFLSVQSLGTVAVATPIAITARTAATSFTITSANVADTSVVAWEIFEPA